MSGVAARFDKPFASVLLDFNKMLRFDGTEMFISGRIGQRRPNPQHFAALAGFVAAYDGATRNASERHLQIFLLNGPGARHQRYMDPNTTIAYPMSPAEFNGRIVGDDLLRAELAAYVKQLVSVMRPFAAAGVQLRLTGQLEDNLNHTGAVALHEVMTNPNMGGWPWAAGRNVCPACTSEFPADSSRVGDYWEHHVNSEAQVNPWAAQHRPGDSWSNDGWLGSIPASNRSQLAAVGAAKQLWTHYWSEDIQGYTHAAVNGRPTLAFDAPPAQLVSELCAGLATVMPQDCD